jgi:D-alanyl-D-alanine carboxypeptidase
MAGEQWVAEVETTKAVPVGARVRVGSITKTFVATVVLQLVDEGWLRLDDSVEHWLPGVVPNGSRITVRQLKATGHTYGDETERRLIRPLGLHGTSVPGTSPWIRGPHPHGYIRTGQGLLDYTELNPSLFGASGEMISTTADLNTFFATLLGGQLLPRRLLDEMKTPGTKDGTYGLGLSWYDTSCGTRVYGNDGDALAYRAHSFSTADTYRQITVAVTPNFTNNPDAPVSALVDKAICS